MHFDKDYILVEGSVETLHATSHVLPIIAMNPTRLLHTTSQALPSRSYATSQALPITALNLMFRHSKSM